MGTFEQAQIPVENADLFQLVRGVFDRLFGPDEIEKFLKAVKKRGLPIRNYEAVLASGAMEKASDTLAQMRVTARELYEALPSSDQAQVREFYLVRLEQVDGATRRKFHQVYRLN